MTSPQSYHIIGIRNITNITKQEHEGNTFKEQIRKNDRYAVIIRFYDCKTKFHLNKPINLQNVT